ncbi:MAG: cytochrome-c peroxidase [Bacteroidia bacterium]|jgi:cytochrome c peroxidase
MRFYVAITLTVLIFTSCRKDEQSDFEVNPTPVALDIPSSFPQALIPADNPLTEEGIFLGRKLFYDPILSGDNTISCASCHMQNAAFVDAGTQFSLGVNGAVGTRNAMPLFNLAWGPGFFWDGGATNLESQVIGPITNPVEMHENLEHALNELKAHPEYPYLFFKAFGSNSITTANLMRAVAQFERTLISADSKYDRYLKGQATLTEQELNGLNLFTDMNKGDCNHCHALGGLFTDFGYRNTGLDFDYADEGRYLITLNEADKGKFKTPSLRNIALTAPYMHDGRFATLMECIEHYNTGFVLHPNLDPALAFVNQGRMTPQEMQDIVAFLNTLTDSTFINNPKFAAP